jgi:hypothetical protein
MGRRVATVIAATLVVAAVTVVVFLLCAGNPTGADWPISFELRSSDNGVLFQFSQDVFDGRALDWSFSPQVFVFPEIPISLVAYALAGGTVQLYYLLVAALNASLLYLGVLAVLNNLYSTEPLFRRLLRAGIALLPILLLPLFGSTWLFEYPLAPTYYFGMYLMILIAPMLFLQCGRPAKIVLGIGIALTAAANPLALVFTIPAFVCVLVIKAISGGIRSITRPSAWAGAAIVLALAIRLTLFGRLQGTSPFSYVSSVLFAGRLDVINGYLQSLLGSADSAIVLGLGTVLLAAGLIVAIVLAVRMIRGSLSDRGAPLVALYYSLVPITGLAGTLVLLITDYLYLWPVVILPLVLVLMPLPRRWVPWVAVAGAAGLVVAGVFTGISVTPASVAGYFSYRSAETQCLDARLPSGMTVGYATFSDARRIELTSRRGIRLIQLKSSGVRAYWLTNRDYARDSVGRFFYINEHGDEPAISVPYLERHFGSPDSSFSCAPGQRVLIYTSGSKLAKIKARYSTLPAP